MGINLSIKDWDEEDRPREKLVAKGRTALSNSELIAILISSGNKNETAVELAKKIMLSAKNNLNTLANLSLLDLQKHKGIGQAKAITIAAAIELGRRIKASEVKKRRKISSSNDLYEFFYRFVSNLDHEEFWALYMDSQNKIIDAVKIGTGGLMSTVADVRIIMKHAIEKLATSFAICHNHPAGKAIPSEPDKRLTSRIEEAGKILNIILLDHIIIAESGYFSFADSNMID